MSCEKEYNDLMVWIDLYLTWVDVFCDAYDNLATAKNEFIAVQQAIMEGDLTGTIALNSFTDAMKNITDADKAFKNASVTLSVGEAALEGSGEKYCKCMRKHKED